MKDNDGLKDNYRRAILDVLTAHPRVERVVLFGSRAMGTFTPESDVDLALYGKQLTLTDLARLKEQIEETTIPQKVDLLLAEAVEKKELLEHIRKHGVEWFRRDAPGDRKPGSDNGRRRGSGGEWVEMSFTEAVEINPKSSLQRGSVYPFVDMKAVGPGRRAVSESEFKVFKGGGSRFMPFDTLMARITPCLENGKIAQYVPSKGTNGPAFGSTEFIVIRGREGVTDNDYAYYLTAWKDFRLFAISQMTGSSGRQRVPADSLSKFIVSIPKDLNEQRAIARILGTLDDKIELNRRMNETLEAMAQALFKSWFVDFDPVMVNAIEAGNSIPDKFAERAAHYREQPDALGLPERILRLFPDRFVASEPGPIPEGWEVKPIGKLVRCVGGATPGTKNPKFWEGGTNPFLTPRDMASLDAPLVLDTGRHITEAGVEKISSKRLPVGAVVLSSRAPIGYLAINEVPVSINQGIIAMICDGEIPNHYAFFWVKNNMEVIKGQAGGTTFAEISKKNFRSIPALRPSDAILNEFVHVAGPLHRQMVENTITSLNLAKLRDTLLPKLISGELRVPDVEKILEGVGAGARGNNHDPTR
jgi:type I restriction enzyme S subunit